MVEMGLEVEEVAMADPEPHTGAILAILLFGCVLHCDAAGTEMNIGRSHGTGAGLPVAAVVEVVTTWGSEVPHTGVDLGMDTGTISGDHPGDLQGGKIISLERTMTIY